VSDRLQAENVLKTSGYQHSKFIFMNTTMKVLSSFLAGAAIGTVAGVLIAPDRGSNTRKKIKDESQRLSHGIAESVNHALDTLTHTYRDGSGAKKEYENGELERSKATA